MRAFLKRRPSLLKTEVGIDYCSLHSHYISLSEKSEEFPISRTSKQFISYKSTRRSERSLDSKPFFLILACSTCIYVFRIINNVILVLKKKFDKVATGCTKENRYSRLMLLPMFVIDPFLFCRQSLLQSSQHYDVTFQGLCKTN